MCVNNLPRVVKVRRNGRKLNSQPLDHKSYALTITTGRHADTKRMYYGTKRISLMPVVQ